MSLLTFREAAERFCEMDARPIEDVSSVYLQVKGLYDRGLVKSVAKRAARGAHRINIYELCRARLLLVLLDFGVRAEQLAKVNSQLDNGGLLTLPDGKVVDFSLKGLIASGRTGEWVLRLYVLRVQDNAGQIGLSAKLCPARMAVGKADGFGKEGDPTHLDNNSVFLAGTLLAFIKMPATALIAPLLPDA